MGIQRKLFAAFILLLAAALTPTAILLERWLTDDIVQVLQSSLAREASALASELQRAPPTDLAAWTRQVAGRAEARITLLTLDGRVVADSEVEASQVAQLESHADRPEVKEARLGHPGTSVRRSTTLGKDLLYLALPVGSPPIQILRLALSLGQVNQTVGKGRAAIWLSALIALTLALLCGAAITRWLRRPILAMARAAREMGHGHFGVELPRPSNDELGELVRALDTLRTELASRIDELKEQGVRLRTILDGMSEGVALIEDGVITVANPAFSRLLNTKTILVGKSALEAARLPALAEAVDLAGRNRKESEREVEAAGRSLALRARPLGPTGARQAVVVLLDLTESKRLDRIRREFVANASHELRTPVAAIVGAAETLAAGAAEDPQARHSFVDILLRHAERLSRLTADLLDLGRLEAGYRPGVEAVPLDAAVEPVLATLRPGATEQQVTLAAELTSGLSVAAERAAVEQILTNLIENAIKYTPRGGRVTVRGEPRGANVQLSVEDTGAGIDAKHLPRLFERFYRVDAARSRELGGTGLGLAIVKHLVMAHRGEIRVESTPGRGSRFIVTLPRA